MFAYFETGCLCLMQTLLSVANCLDFDQVLRKLQEEVQIARLFGDWDAKSDRWKQETPETVFLLPYDTFPHKSHFFSEGYWQHHSSV